MSLSAGRNWLLLLLSCNVLWLSGCGTAKANFSGMVTYKGKPVTSGTIWFQVGTALVDAPIGSDGSYTVTGVPVGKVKVGVSSPPPPGMDPMMSAAATGRKLPGAPEGGTPATNTTWVKLPDSVSDPETSNLEVEVARSTKELPIVVPE
jgi:hypothetical protein